jgi:hypothetical protein
MNSKWGDAFFGVFVATAIVGLVVVVIALPMWGMPKWGVYRANLAGEAQLRQAEQNRRITVLEAQAALDSADLKRQADVIRAHGIAAANEIIGRSITPEYIQWRWVEGLNDGKSEVIYIPTEANLPILEALRKANK